MKSNEGTGESHETSTEKPERGGETINFFAELKRRNVYKVAVTYAVVAWLLIQAAAILFPTFQAPAWVMRVFVVMLAAGFVLALIIAWAFEMTPEGMKRTEDVNPHEKIPQWSRRKFAALILVIAIAAASLLGYQVFRTNPPALSAAASPEMPTKSIAVLPFENLSRDPDNAYFAEGVQEEVLTRLSKIGDLRVISRSSTQNYKSVPEKLSDVGKQLRVANIVEGSVQKSGDKVRVNVQLIRAADDSHLWADTFDRKVTDVFSAESEIAKTIADQLGARLTGGEQQAIAVKPTDVPEAYDAYLRGLAYDARANAPTNVLPAQDYLRRAVRLDPKFALAWARLARIDAAGYLSGTLERTPALREEADHAAETALSLQPNLGEALYAKGYYHYGCLKDYDTAARYFEQARKVSPNMGQVPEGLAYIARRRREWERSDTLFKEAERLDPRNTRLLEQHALLLTALRRFPDALHYIDEALAIAPEIPDLKIEKAAIAQVQGDLARSAGILASVQVSPAFELGVLTQSRQDMFERKPAAAVAHLREVLAHTDPALPRANAELRFSLGWAQKVAGDEAGAHQTFTQARNELETLLKQEPANGWVMADLALACMGLGDKKAALEFAEQGIVAYPVEKDALLGPAQTEILARVAAQTGEPDRAIALLDKLLVTPYGTWFSVGALTPALLRLDPMFDPLRNDPRFQKLCQEPNK